MQQGDFSYWMDFEMVDGKSNIVPADRLVLIERWSLLEPRNHPDHQS